MRCTAPVRDPPCTTTNTTSPAQPPLPATTGARHLLVFSRAAGRVRGASTRRSDTRTHGGRRTTRVVRAPAPRAHLTRPHRARPSKQRRPPGPRAAARATALLGARRRPHRNDDVESTRPAGGAMVHLFAGSVFGCEHDSAATCADATDRPPLPPHWRGMQEQHTALYTYHHPLGGRVKTGCGTDPRRGSGSGRPDRRPAA